MDLSKTAVVRHRAANKTRLSKTRRGVQTSAPGFAANTTWSRRSGIALLVRLCHGAGDHTIHKTFQTFTYMPSKKTSYERNDDLVHLGQQITNALEVHGKTIKMLSNGPFSSGPYTVSISEPSFEKIDDQNPTVASVRVR